MRLVIDRFEGSFAVCEDENRNMSNIPRSKLPEDAMEGSVLIVSETGITVDIKETAERSKIIKKKMDDLFE